MNKSLVITFRSGLKRTFTEVVECREITKSTGDVCLYLDTTDGHSTEYPIDTITDYRWLDLTNINS